MKQIPTDLEPLLEVLARRHWEDQLLQIYRLGIDHPQGRAAQKHLDEARRLAIVAGVNTSVAA